MEKSTFRRVWVSFPQAVSIRWVMLHFPMLRETDGKPKHFPCDEVY